MPKLKDPIDRDIALTHERFVEVMEQRMPHLSPESKERYFAVLSLLVAKLEDSEKSMQEILREMMVDAANMIMEELNSF